MKLAVGLMLFFSGLASAMACSCGASAPFLTMAYRADLVVVGIVEAQSGHGMDFRIEDIFRGEEPADLVRIWGDNGALCRPYTSRFPVGTRWVLTLSRTGEEGPGGPPGQQYAVGGCGIAYLAVADESVYVPDRLERWQLDRLAREIDVLDLVSPPPTQDEVYRLRSMIAAGLIPAETRVPPPAAATTQAEPGCSSRLFAAIDGASISSFEPIVAGGLDPPKGADANLARRYQRLPSLCRVTGLLIPTRDNAVPFELWIPSALWAGEIEGIVTTGPITSRDLVGVNGNGLLDHGTALFVLSPPAGQRTGSAELIAGFRGIVDRLNPSVPEGPRSFRGTTAMISGGMDPRGATTAALVPEGPGRIEGRVTLQGVAVNGLRLRFAVNASLWSPWMSTDGDGRYGFDLPYGIYSIDSYQVDSLSAERLLPGAIDHPYQSPRIESVIVDGSGPAQGVDLSYVYPIELRWPVGDVTVEQARRVAWAPYPGADHYGLSISRRTPPSRFDGQRSNWSADGIRETIVDLPVNEFVFAPGEYELRLTAKDADGREMSSISSMMTGFRFRIVE